MLQKKNIKKEMSYIYIYKENNNKKNTKRFMKASCFRNIVIIALFLVVLALLTFCTFCFNRYECVPKKNIKKQTSYIYKEINTKKDSERFMTASCFRNIMIIPLILVIFGVLFTFLDSNKFSKKRT